jgi:hypothetical protein
MLAKKFEQAGFVDLALEQYQEQLRLAREAGPRQNEKDAAFEERMRTVELAVQEFERSSNLKQRRTEYELRAKDKRPAVKLQLALKAGLGRVASDIVLNESDPTQLGPPGLNVALMVLVQTGQAALARHTDLAESERDQLFLAEIFGEYEKVDEYLGRMIDSDRDKGTRDLLGNLFAVTWNEDASPAGLNDLNKAAQTVREEADLLCIRGIFALEWGHTAEATRHFRQAMEIGFPRVHFASSLSGLTATTPLELLTVAAGDRLAGPGSNFDFETRRIAARYLELLRAAGN